ncbi:MAG TPA: HAMP domain-containing sensor histidine kinase [Bryobacteraceae bacterium]|nr:HAMP domain-containing sensor histidine kinase [Bryobacteraceae bacterium]
MSAKFGLNIRVLSLATLVLVVLTLAGLQYRWIHQVSDAEETRAKLHVRQQVNLVVDALDTEVTRAALAFTIPPAPASSMYSELKRAWETWNHEAPWPRIVLGISFLESDHGAWRTRPLGEPATFDVRSILPGDVLLGSPPSEQLRAGTIFAKTRNLNLFINGQPSLLRPLPAFSEPLGVPQMNWTVIRFNQKYLVGAVFPRLLEKYFTAEDRSEFQFELGPKGPAALGAVTVADLFRDRPDCLTPYGVGGAVMVSGGAAGSATSLVSQHSAFVSQFGVGQPVPLNSLLHAVGQCQLPVAPSSSGLLQLTVRRPQGTVADVFTGFRLRNELVSGLVLAVLLTALSVLVVSTERARKLARMQTVIAAGISHELRTPLASLRVAADDLRSGHVASVEQARRYGEIIDLQSRRLGHVVDQSLALATPAQSNGSPCLRRVPVPEILAAALNALAPLLSKTEIQVERRIAPDVPRILADSESALRCLTNLIENAIKYAGSGGWILLSARGCRHSGRSMVEVIIEDRGPGIERDEVASVFEPFYRGKSARCSREPGSGLGLAIARHTMEAHGGSIKLESVLPKGCRFRLFFLPEDPAIVYSADSEAAG